jgi:hypothetical protein
MKNGIKREKFKLKIGASSLSEDERRRLLFECFDILLALNQMRGRKAQETNFNIDSISTKEYDNIVGK